MRMRKFLHIEKYQEIHTKKKTIRVNKKLSKVARYKINIQKLIVFLCTSDEQPGNEVKKTIPFTPPSKNKILRNKLKKCKACMLKLQNIIERN